MHLAEGFMMEPEASVSAHFIIRIARTFSAAEQNEPGYAWVGTQRTSASSSH